ncbi:MULTISPECIES: purine-nucleoside phosphorylase [unclassified Flammeovirga]|uniref:purine-nucleoside phosphorylase n=1 Tax=unclassified Flammeovirga TaxID=2637820 RepID=UPI0005C7303F|nr:MULTISPECIES: purine-nucleoside phosphorylase [unclassified Flammeovirga]MBD0405147.1 purine-nucleoside phosphorylase [Flammeovirga sp. EKP202]
MSIHIGAKPGDIAEVVLMPGDPLRAKFIAENYLENPVQYNNVRGMLGYTGTYKGHKISVQGSGMGIPSIGIYAHELVTEFGVRKLIRVGSCGSMQPHIKPRDLVFAMSASTDSSFNQNRFGGKDYSPAADFDMIAKANQVAKEKGITPFNGNVLSSDTFYGDDADEWKKWAKYGVLAVEMETTALYTIAAQFNAHALTILTVSDSLVTGEELSSDDRQNTFTDMMEIALETAIDGL